MTTQIKSLTEEPTDTVTSPSRQEILEQCDRITVSKDFCNALSQQRLLQFLVVETIEGRGSGLKEYSVGLEVFQRTHDFDPRTDAIVRVTVGQLRRRLAAYYSSEGTADRVLIQIPKGHYLAEFTLVDVLSPQKALPASSLPDQQQAAEDPHPSTGWTYRRIALVAFVVLVALVVASVAGWLRLRKEEAAKLENARPVDLRQSLLWSTFMHGETHAIGVVGIASTVAIGPVIVRVPDVNDRESMQSNATIQKLSALLGAPAAPYDVYTGIGEALSAGRLQRAFTESSLDLTLLASREVRWQDLHADNVIFISSLRFRDLRTALGGPSDFAVQENGSNGLEIINRAPRPGEQAVYQPSGNYTAPSVDYALVSIVPGTVANRSILTVGGTATLGTGGGVQFITERQSLADLDAKLRRDAPAGNHGSLQILLRVDIIDNQIISVHYVTHHWIPA